MSKKFWLEHITLHKSPGFASGTFPPVKKLGEHLNVVWGPNAVGKSTLSRAMRALIWKTKSGNTVEAEGLLHTPESDWNLALAQGELTQTRLNDNQEIPLPGRNDELSESYWFTLHELLQEGDASTASFLRQVRTSMQGGVNLDLAAENAGGIASFSSGNIAQAKEVRQAGETLQQIIRTQAGHQGIQDAIASLQEEVDQAPELSVKKALLEDAQRLLTLTESIEEQRRKLALYPPSILLIDKSSPKRLEELLEAQHKAQEEERAYRQTRDRLQPLLVDCAISAEHLEDREKPGRIANQYDAYKDALTIQKNTEQEFVSANQDLLEWEREHAWLTDGQTEDKTLQSFVGTLKTLAHECEPLRCDVAANKRLLDELGEPEAIAHPVQDLSLLQVRLSDWLDSYWKVQGTPKGKAMQPGKKKWLLLIVLVIGSLSTYLGIVFHPGFSALGFVLILLSVFVLLPTSAKNNEYKEAEQALLLAQQEAEKLVNKLDKELPASWTPAFCNTMSVALSFEIATSQKTEQLNLRRKNAHDHHERAVQRLQKWTSDWYLASKAIGLKGDEASLEGAQFFHFAERLKDWSDYRLKFVHAQESLAVAKKETAHALSLLQVELDTQEGEITSLKAKCDSMIERFTEALSLQASIGENEGRSLTSLQHLQTTQDAIKRFWENIQVAVGNEAELTELVAKLDTWNALRYSLNHNRGLYEQKVKESPEALAMATNTTLDDLSARVDKIIQDQNELEGKREELGGLRSTFEALKFGSDLSKAQLQEASALAELGAFRKEQVMARMIEELAGELKDESERQFQPQVLKHASRWLSEITRHRYTLSANDEGFFATDTIMAKNHHLDELSSGTRVQLLFSIRMAFITMQEETSGVRLPIFLDELLANSDDERALAIAVAIGNIAEERQVFYVTAQRDEVEKLRTIATSEVTVIALEDLRRDFRVSKYPLKAYVYDREEIIPIVENYHEYGKALSVSGASLWSPLEALHSWHLFSNSEELHGYLHEGLSRLGPLISAKASQIPSLAFRIEILKSAQQRSQQGRAKRIHLSDLEDPSLDVNRGAKFWSQIQKVVGTEGCSGQELLQAVDDKRIQRFTDANSDVLSTWLYDNRFASDSESKSSQNILEDLFVEFDALTVGSEEERIVGRWLDAVIG